ncbi:MAG: glycosyltransferase family 2 protein [Chromatiales bacterium]|jgi:glycosyltransferase involved in cell wall biosynthesis
MPRFSVIVTTLDRPHSLSKALRGIQAQSFPDFEVIVLDDGSAPATLEAYQGLRADLDERFAWHLLPPRGDRLGNPSTARNAALARCAGDLVAFCDDDDYWSDSDHLNRAAEVFESDPEVDLFFADQVGVCDGETRIGRWQPHLPAALGRARNDSVDLYDVSLEAYCGQWVPHLNTLVARRDLVSRAGGFWAYTPVEGDVEFAVRAAALARKRVFRDAVVAVHNVPDRDRRANASTRVTQTQRYLFRIAIAGHLRAATPAPAVHRFARRLERYAAQKLVAEIGRTNAPGALAFAWKGFVLGPSPHAAALLMRALSRRLRRDR